MPNQKEGLYYPDGSYKNRDTIIREAMTKGELPVLKTPTLKRLTFTDYWSPRFIKRQEEVLEAREQLTNNVEIQFPSERICINFMGDLHTGGECDYSRVSQEIQTIVSTPNSYLMLMGDVIDGFFFNYAQMEQIEQVPEQIQYTKSLLKYLGENKKLLVGWGGDHDCLDETTEVYTKNKGWITYDKLEDTDELLTMGNGLEWCKYDNKIVDDYDGEMYEYNSDRFSILATPRHRMFLKKRKKEEYLFMNMEEFASLKSPDAYKVPIASSFNNKDFDIEDYLLYLIGFVMADGGIKRERIMIYQSKIKTLEKLKFFLAKNNIEYREQIRNRKRGELCGMEVKTQLPDHILFLNKDISKKLIELFNGDKHKIPEFVYKLSDRQFNIFLEGLVDGDGSHFKNAMCFYQKDENFIDQLQFLCLSHNLGCSKYSYVGRSKNVQYRLNINNRQSIRLAQKTKKVHYTGKIWDVSIPPNRNFLVRRKGKAFFTGNSWMDKMGNSMYADFNENTGAYFMKGVGYVTLQVGSVEYKLTGAHKLPGSSIYNNNHPQDRAMRFGGAWGSDIIVSAHTHKKGHSEKTIVGFGGEATKVHQITTGPYKTQDEYSKKNGWSKQVPTEMYGSAVILEPDIKLVRYYDDILLANQEL